MDKPPSGSIWCFYPPSQLLKHQMKCALAGWISSTWSHTYSRKNHWVMYTCFPVPPFNSQSVLLYILYIYKQISKLLDALSRPRISYSLQVTSSIFKQNLKFKIGSAIYFLKYLDIFWVEAHLICLNCQEMSRKEPAASCLSIVERSTCGHYFIHSYSKF